MRIAGTYEDVTRGTPEFPLGFYRVDSTHPNYHMQLHWHVEYEIIHICSGTLTLFLDEETLVCTGGDAVLIAGSTLHGATPRSCVYECAVFDPRSLFQGSWRTALEGISGFISLPAGSRENQEALAFFDALHQTEGGAEFMILGALCRFFGVLRQKKLFGSLPAASSKKIQHLKQALKLMETEYASTLTLAQLAQACGMSPKYFCRFFREMTHKTPIDYLNRYRIKIACEMLRDNQESITEIAFSCGFNDLSYFIKTFKRYKGVSPKAYAKQSLQG